MIPFALGDEKALADQVAANLRRAAGSIDGDRVKCRIARAVRLPYWRTYDLWYGRARLIKPAELARIAAAAPSLAGAATSSCVPESDLERIRSLESEVDRLRSDLVAALQRMEGGANA